MKTKKADKIAKTKNKSNKSRKNLGAIITFVVGLALGFGTHDFVKDLGKDFTKSLSEQRPKAAKSSTDIDINTMTIDKPDTAEKNFAQACRNGITPACYNWGFLKKQNSRLQEARFLYDYACKKGYELSCGALRAL